MCDLVTRPGIGPRPPALGAWSLSHWTTGEVPVTVFWVFKKICIYLFLAVLGLHCGMAFSLGVMCGLLTAVRSFSCFQARSLGAQASVVAVP